MIERMIKDLICKNVRAHKENIDLVSDLGDHSFSKKVENEMVDFYFLKILKKNSQKSN